MLLASLGLLAAAVQGRQVGELTTDGALANQTDLPDFAFVELSAERQLKGRARRSVYNGKPLLLSGALAELEVELDRALAPVLERRLSYPWSVVVAGARLVNNAKQSAATARFAEALGRAAATGSSARKAVANFVWRHKIPIFKVVAATTMICLSVSSFGIAPLTVFAIGLSLAVISTGLDVMQKYYETNGNPWAMAGALFWGVLKNGVMLGGGLAVDFSIEDVLSKDFFTWFVTSFDTMCEASDVSNAMQKEDRAFEQGQGFLFMPPKEGDADAWSKIKAAINAIGFQEAFVEADVDEKQQTFLGNAFQPGMKWLACASTGAGWHAFYKKWMSSPQGGAPDAVAVTAATLSGLHPADVTQATTDAAMGGAGAEAATTDVQEVSAPASVTGLAGEDAPAGEMEADAAQEEAYAEACDAMLQDTAKPLEASESTTEEVPSATVDTSPLPAFETALEFWEKQAKGGGL